MILDTTVLIDLQKEFRRDQPGAASNLLETLGEVWGEVERCPMLFSNRLVESINLF